MVCKKLVNGELSLSVLAICDIAICAEDIAISEQKHEPSDQQKWNQNSETWNFAKTQKRSKLKIFTSWDRKFVHPPPDFGKGKPEQPKVLAHG